MCWACINLGDLLTTDNRLDEAESVLQQGLSHAARGLRDARSPDSARIGSEYTIPGALRTQFRDVDASLNHRLATVYCRAGRVDGALPLFQRALEEIESLCLASPGNRGYWTTVRYVHEDVLRQLQQAGRTDDARQIVRQMSEWLQQIGSRVPDELAPQNELLLTELMAIKVLKATGQAIAADAQLAKSLKTKPIHYNARLTVVSPLQECVWKC